MAIVSFKSQRISTTANTTINPASIIGARLVSTTTADVIVHLHDTRAATSASTRIATLFATNPGVDELGYPVRVYTGTLIVSPTGTSSTLYVFVR